MILQQCDQLNYTPARIVSLVPSQTELLHALNLENETIAITKFCVHPDSWFKNKIRVGGTKTIDLEQIKSLSPDLIIANKEENVREQVEALASDFAVWLTDVNDLAEAYQMVADVGMLAGKVREAEMLNEAIRYEFSTLPPAAEIAAAYLIWKDPYMVAGGDSFISDMMEHAGFRNVFADRKRYPEATIEEISAAGADILLLSSEPYPFNEKHVQQISQTFSHGKIMLVDGEMFSWYGSRLKYAPAYFKKINAR